LKKKNDFRPSGLRRRPLFAGKRSGAAMIELFTYETPNGEKASIML
jgi:hypothetical protein